MGTIPVCICSRTCLIRDKADWHVVLSDYDPELASRECKSNNEKMCWSKIYLDATSLSFMCMDGYKIHSRGWGNEALITISMN